MDAGDLVYGLEGFAMTCPKCQREMERNNLGAVRGWFCYDCDEFIEDEEADAG